MASILAISGSNRDGSLNQNTVDALASIASDKGATVNPLDLRSLALPVYDGDLEAADGLPPGAASLRQALSDSNGLIVGCPEYNGFMTPLLINAIDWSTRKEGGNADTSPWRDKVVMICSASPGGFGGMRAAAHLRTMLSGIGCIVLPQTVAVPAAHQAFDEAGTFADEKLAERAAGMVDKMLDVATRLA